jgi:hypothetical protein
VGLADESLADLSAALNPCPSEYAGIGYWPIQEAEPTPADKVAVDRHVELVAGLPKWIEEIEDAPPLPFPDLTRRQVRLALLSIGITREDVNAQIELIEDAEERAYSMIEWEDANSFKRDHPLVASLAVTFSLPAVQVDNLWRWAASL